MGFSVDDIKNRELLFHGGFGLEKENLRIDENGYLAHTRHPFKDDKNISKDFCENQTELITDVCQSTEELWNEINRLQNRAQQTLLRRESGKEYLWPFSNPPYVRGEDDIAVASFYGNLKDKEIYRNYLAKKYGKKKMLFCGIHYNFSFSDEFLWEMSGEKNPAGFQEYKNNIYIELGEKMMRCSWLIVYLTAASPVFDSSFYEEAKPGSSIISAYASPRCSEIGYWNPFIPLLCYDTLEQYADSIQSYIDSGQLRSIEELYLPVRLKPQGENSLENLRKNGVSHIELRMLDLNPLSPVGIMREDLEFIHLLLVYLMFGKKEKFEDFEQVMAINNMKKAARYGGSVLIETSWSESRKIREAALCELKNMKAFFAKFCEGESVGAVIDYQIEKVQDTEKNYAMQVSHAFGGEYVKKGISLAKKYAAGNGG